MAKHTMAWSTYLNAMAFDYDEFVAEFDQIAAYVAPRPWPRSRHRTVHISHTRPGVVTVVATRQELSALAAGARMALR